jgi:HEAT repeat protein
MRAKDAIDPLARALLNTTQLPSFRVDCARALGYYSIDDEQAVISLIGALADPRAEIKRSVAISLGQITGRYLGEDQAKWKVWLEEERAKKRARPGGGA